MIRRLIETTQLTLQQIADKLGVSYKRVRSAWLTYPKEYRDTRKRRMYRRSKMGVKNPMLGRMGQLHHNYKGIVGDSKGYLMVLRPDWYTGRRRSKHVFLHSVVVCEHMDITEVPKGWCVHHCDNNPHNNRFCNLVLMTTSDHIRLHAYMRHSGVTTISKESTLKWVEAHGTPWRQDIV